MVVCQTYQQGDLFQRKSWRRKKSREIKFEASIISRTKLVPTQASIKMTMEVSAVSAELHFPDKASVVIQFVKKPSTLWLDSSTIYTGQPSWGHDSHWFLFHGWHCHDTWKAAALFPILTSLTRAVPFIVIVSEVEMGRNQFDFFSMASATVQLVQLLQHILSSWLFLQLRTGPPSD